MHTLNPNTENLVATFADALREKLAAAEQKYGYSDNWRTDDWEADCQRDLLGHVAKGDPLDVAAYAAFCWARGWKTAAPATPTREREAAEAIRSAFFTTNSGWPPHRYYLSLAYKTMDEMRAAEDAMKAWAKGVSEPEALAPAEAIRDGGEGK